MKNNHLIPVALLTLGAIIAANVPAHADVVYDNLGVGDSFSNAPVLIAPPTQFFNTPVYFGVAFTPVADTTLATAQFGFRHLQGAAADYTMTIVNSVAGLPGTTEFASATYTDNDTVARLRTISFATATPLTGGTPYWAVLRATNLTGDTFGFWYENNIGRTGYAQNTFNNWSAETVATPSLRLTGVAVVPEGSSVFLALCGIGAAFVVKRRKASAK